MRVWRRRLLPALVLLLPLVGVTELGLHLYFRQRAPRFESYSALAEPLAAIRAPGDLLVVEPPWADPLVRREAATTVARAAPSDDGSHAHAVEVSLFGDRGDRLASWPSIEERTVGPFTLRRLQNPQPSTTLFDFVDRLSPGQVDVRFSGRPCPWNPSAVVVAGGLGGHPAFPSARFECGERPWFNVSETVIADERFEPRRCIWAHPPERGELVIRYRDVDLGEHLVGHAGMYWIIERERQGTPVRLAISVEDEEIAEVVHRDGDGWAPFHLDLGRHRGRRGATVTFAVSSPDYRDRHFCFEARVR